MKRAAIHIALIVAFYGVQVGAGLTQSNIGEVPLPRPRPFYQPVVAPVPLPPMRPAHTPSTAISLTLADAIFMGLRNNRKVKSAYIDRIAEKFDLRVAESAFTPQFAVGGSISHQSISGVTSTNIDVSPEVSVLAPTGATFKFAWNNASHQSAESQTLDSVAELTFKQPLLRGAGIDVNMAPIRTARLGENINRLRLRATVAETMGEIIFAHRDLLLAQEETRLAESAVQRGESAVITNAALIAAGRMPNIDAIQTQADLENQRFRVLQVKQRRETARLALLGLLAVDFATPLIAFETLKLKPIPLEINRLVSIALLQRADYQGQLHVIAQNRIGVTVAENEKLWDLDLFARGRIGSQYSSVADTRSVSDLTVGIRFSIPINDLQPQQRYVQASTGLQGAELALIGIREGIKRQLYGTVAEIDILWRQISIAEKALELAERAVNVERDKLNAGRSTTFQVRIIEDNLRSSETQLLNAKIGYLNALTRLDLQLGTTLQTWKIKLQDE